MEDVVSRYFKQDNRPALDKQELFATGEWAHRVDISEAESNFTIKAVLPEIKKEDVKIVANNGVLSIRGGRKQKKIKFIIQKEN